MDVLSHATVRGFSIRKTLLRSPTTVRRPPTGRTVAQQPEMTPVLTVPIRLNGCLLQSTVISTHTIILSRFLVEVGTISTPTRLRSRVVAGLNSDVLYRYSPAFKGPYTNASVRPLLIYFPSIALNALLNCPQLPVIEMSY